MFPLRFPPAPVAVVALACLALPLLCLTGCSDNVTTVESQEKSAVSRTGEDPGSAELDPLPPAPESQILDDGRVFSHAPGELAQLAKYLKELKQNSGIEIFVAMYGFLDGETVEERANRLREAWANRNTGVVVVYESGGGDVIRGHRRD
ncbi:MAG: hypothetical protein R3F19_13640 [Verrucomicrobiales bacterium]